MTTIDLDDLEAKARAATPGEWRAWNYNGLAPYNVIIDHQGSAYVLLQGNQHFLGDAVRNAAFVASANPATVLALIERIRELEHACEIYRTDYVRK